MSFVALSLAVPLVLGAPRTSPETEACFASAVEGQELRNAGKLSAARGKLVACSQVACPSEVSRECTRWLEEVDALLPTFVFGARDGSGADVPDARIFVDDVPVGASAGGRPIPIDPGPHRVRFEHVRFAPVTEEIVARGGEKNRTLVVRLGDPPRAPTRSGSPLPWILGGAGVVALGVFAGFAITGLGDYNEHACDKGCSKSDKESVDTKFLVADVALGVSVVAIAAAVVLWATAPKTESRTTRYLF